MITISERVQIPHSPELVWSVISDPTLVVECVEGSELGETHEDGSFDARIAVKFAALKVAFRARARLDLDEAEQTGRLEATGSDARGSTRVGGHATFTVRPAEGSEGSVVDMDGVIDITGQLASLVTTGASVVVSRMTRSFTTQLTATCDRLAAPAETVPTALPAATAEPGTLHRLLAALRSGVRRLVRLVTRRREVAVAPREGEL